MSSKVEILCPNGHRVTVKTTNNMSLMQILEEACNKKGFLPASEYELRHGNTKKGLDLTVAVRFSGLPNNAKLEMVKAAKSREMSDVTLALQLETGERIQNTFKPQTSLWGVIQQSQIASGKELTECPEGIHPVCVYMRDEVIGEFALKETTLQALGLVGGRAAVRLLYKAVDPAVLNDLQQKMLKDKSRQATLASRGTALQSQTLATTQPEISHQNHAASSEKMDTVYKHCDQSRAQVPDSSAVERLAPEMVADSSEPMEVEERPRDDALRQATDIADSPMESDQTQVVSSSGSHSGGNIGCGAGQGTSSSQSRQSTECNQPGQFAGPDCSIPGVQIYRPGEIQLTAEQEGMARQLAETIMPGVFPRRSEADVERLRQERQRRIQQSRPTSKPPVTQPPVTFTEFKFPEETKGKDLYRNDMSEQNGDDYKPCDREAVIYSVEETVQPDTISDEPDEDFFEVTDSDVKKMWADLQKSLVDQSDQPLMTQTMRRAQAETRLAKYQRAFIRFTFPDKLVLQATFRPRESVYNLYKFVKEVLEDKSAPFYLYTSPPKKVLDDRSQTLIEAELVPMTVVYFGSEVKKEHYLSSAAMKEMSSQLEANSRLVAHLPKGSVSSAESAPQGIKRSTPQSPSSSPSQSSNSDGKKLPKWFKVGRK